MSGRSRIPTIVVRSAELADAPLLLRLIDELAEYERLPNEAIGTEQLIAEHLFGPRPVADSLIAEIAGETAGFAIFFTTFSTFLCRPGLWLEDLYVRPSHRRAGVGSALLGCVAREALRRRHGRLEWAVLDWNEEALGFYRSLGARPMDEWTTQRLDEAAMRQLAMGDH